MRTMAFITAYWYRAYLGLSERPVKSVMTPRPELEWLDLDAEPAELKERLMAMTHSRLIIARGESDNIEGVV